jgi:arginase
MSMELTIIGAPCSAGAHHAGLERGPAGLRAAGLVERLREYGSDVRDAGDLAPRVFTHDPAHPQARNREQVVQACRDVAGAVAEVLRDGRIPVVVGGDCSITVGAVVGCLQLRPQTGLLYLDGDADFRTPETTIAGNFDGMVIAALLGYGDPLFTGLSGSTPILAPTRLAVLGYDDSDIDSRERHLLDLPFARFDSKQLRADPVGVANLARDHIAPASTHTFVHFDVDAVDSADLPLANYPHHGQGVTLHAAMTALRLLCAGPRFTGIVLTEVNPTHDPSGELLQRYVAGVAAAIAGP